MQPKTNPQADDATLLALHEAGKASRQIEAILGGIDHSTICKRLKHLTPRKTTEIFKALRADIFAEKQRKLLMASDREPASSQSRIAMAVGIYYDKEQIERGHGVDTRPLVMIQINSGRPEPVDKPVEITTNQPVINSTLSK